MHKLFALSYRRILARLNQQELNPSSALEALSSNNIPPSGEGFLYRLPREELKHILNIPCPINSLQDSSSQQIIASSKRLRAHGKLKEEKICGKCPFKADCKVAKQPSNEQMTNTPLDLLIFWSALDKVNKPEDLYFRQWVSAYKLGDSIITGLNDLASGGKQTEQYDRLRLEAIKAYEQKPKPQTSNEKILDERDRIILQQLNYKYKWQDQIYEQKKNEAKKEKIKAQPEAKEMPKEQQVLGRDFSFDEEEEFQPVQKFSKDNYTQRKPEKSYKNKKGYQVIEKNEGQNPKGYKQYPPKSYQRQRQSEEEAPYYQSSERQSKPQRQNKYYKQPRYREEEDEKQYSQPPRSFKQGKKYVQEFQPEERQKYVKYGHKQSTHKEKVSERPYTQRYEKPNPFVARWEPGQETFQAERGKKTKNQERYQERNQERNQQRNQQERYQERSSERYQKQNQERNQERYQERSQEQYQTKQRTPKQQKPQRAEKHQKPPKPDRQTPRIIQVEQIQESQMSSSRSGRAIRRRGRSQPTATQQ